MINSGSTAFAIAGYATCSSLMLVMNKLAVHVLPDPALVLLLQLLASAWAVWLAGFMGLITVDSLELGKVKAFVPVSLAFLAAGATRHACLESRACLPARARLVLISRVADVAARSSVHEHEDAAVRERRDVHRACGGSGTAACACRSSDVPTDRHHGGQVFRASTPILISVCDWAFLGRELPTARSWATLSLLVVGALLYVLTDAQFHVRVARAVQRASW
jgi:hypothetical protein